MRELLTRYWRPLLLCFLITLGGTVAFYTYSVKVRDVPRPRAGSGIPLIKAIAVGAVAFALATACSRGDAVQVPHTSDTPAPAPAAPPAAAPAPTVPPTAAPAPDFVAVSKLINDAIAAQKLPGAVVLIGHGGKVVFQEAYGSRKLGRRAGPRRIACTR